MELLRHPTPELPCTLEDAELCARSMVTQLLWQSTLELMCVLGELLCCPHTGAVAPA